jgi:hypothetical protein
MRNPRRIGFSPAGLSSVANYFYFYHLLCTD